MKRIMISVKPRYVAKILNGEKTLEVRKSAPKEVLKGEECLVEIYCTKDPKHTVAPFKFIEGWCYKEYNDNTRYASGCTANMGETINGQVVARWLLKKYDTYDICDPDVLKNGKQCPPCYFEDYACIDINELIEYIGCGFDNGWGKEWSRGYGWHIQDLEIYDKPKQLEEFGLKRAPQSWCYIN